MCTLRACPFDTLPHPRCTAYFDNTGNKPPTISSFSGPTTLNVNQTGTWAIRASDPENQSLDYQISWGDEPVFSDLIANTVATSFVQTTTFTHSYSAAGVYTVQIVVRDASGGKARTSTTLRVGIVGVDCPVLNAPEGPTCTASNNVQGTWQLYTTDQGCQNWRCAASIPVACTAEYAPVCGRTPDSCFYTDPPPASCSGMGWREERTYSNRCAMNAAGATFLRGGSCMDMIPTGY